MSEEVYLTPEERLQELSDSILSSVICGDADSMERRKYLYGQLPYKVFKDENYVMLKILYNFKDRGITPDEEFLKMYLMRNIKMLKESNEYIDIGAYADQDEDKYLGYISAVIKQYKRLVQETKLSLDGFKLTIEKYRVEYSGIEMNKVYAQARIILYDGIQIGRRFYQGFDDSVAYTKMMSANIENVVNNAIGERFIDSSKEGIVDDERAETELISNFDLLDSLNSYLGGIYTGLMYSIVAPTKGGKSKFTSRLVHTALVQFGVNCSVWANEGGHKLWWSQLRAIHFEWLYIRNASNPNERVAPLSQDDIFKGNYPSEAIRSLEEASRIDLFTNSNYGVCNMITSPLVEETFIDDLTTSIKINNSKLVLVDYLQQISSSQRGRSDSEVVASAYKKCLKFVRDNNVAFISPAQFKQAFIDAVTSSKGGTVETRTSGGESSEVVRTPDVNIALYASLDDLQRNSMQIMSMPSRMTKVFPTTEIYCDLCSCVFSDIEEE